MDVKNCYIAKLIKDRLDRRKYGLRCEDDTSNKNIILSYINKLGCTVIDTSCFINKEDICGNGNEQDITTSTPSPCEIGVTIELTEQVSSFYEYTATATNTFGTVNYSWTWDSSVWSDDFEVGNSWIGSADNGFILTETPITVVVTDERGCQGTATVLVTFKAGCTEPSANNYDPEATYQAGPCLYDPLVLTTNYICQPDNSANIQVSVTGGLAPYTIIGTQDGTNLANGSSFGSYAIDANGAVSNTVTGTIVCPFSCMSLSLLPGVSYTCVTDINGFNTGTAILNINPSGGTAPYVVTGASDGQIVNHNDAFTINVKDSNGCQAPVTNIVINCPPFVPPVDIPCIDVSFDFNAYLEFSSIISTDTARFKIYGELLNLNPGVIITGYDFDVRSLVPATLQCINSLNPAAPNNCQCTSCGGNSSTPEFAGFELDYGLSPVGQDYNFLVDITIYLEVTTGPCVFNFSRVFEGVLQNNPGTIINSQSQSF